MLYLSQRPLTASNADGRLFVGREAELRRLERAARLDFNVLALGERGVGITSLMAQHQRRLEEAGRPCFYISGSKIKDSAQVFDAITTGGLGRRQILSDVHREVMGLPATGSRFHDLVWKITRVEGDVFPVVFLDDMHAPQLTHRMFGRYRDEMWELPCRWVVCGLARYRSEYLTPPADAFFEAEVTTGPLDDFVARDLLEARLAIAGAQDAREVDIIRSEYEEIIKGGGGNPRRILALARESILRDAGENASRERFRQEATRLGGTEGRFWQHILAFGPVSASDEELQEHFGVTRARAAQVLGRLEEAGLVKAHHEKQGVGRPRKVFRVGSPRSQSAPLVKKEARA